MQIDDAKHETNWKIIDQKNFVLYKAGKISFPKITINEKKIELDYFFLLLFFFVLDG